MGEPSLSPSQRAYRGDRAQFLRRLERSADRLFADGYRAAETDCPYVFALTCRHKEKIIVVDALRETCTCAFFTRQVDGEPLNDDGAILPCKHLLGLKGLVKQTRLAHFREGDYASGYRLWVHWIAVLSERWRLERPPLISQMNAPNGHRPGGAHR